MAIEQVKVPRPGESITEATINRWLKADGDYVKVDEPLYELGTDKATQEVAAPVAGALKILVKEGETVAVESVVAQIDTSAKAPAHKPTVKSEDKTKEKPQEAEAARSPEPKAAGIPSPAPTRVIAEAGLKPEQVKGTGPDGRITKEDAVAASANGRREPAGQTQPNKPVDTG